MVEFVEGKVSFVVVKVYYGGLLVGYVLFVFKDYMFNVEIWVVVIYWCGCFICLLGIMVIEVDDEVFFIVVIKYICVVMSEF